MNIESAPAATPQLASSLLSSPLLSFSAKPSSTTILASQFGVIGDETVTATTTTTIPRHTWSLASDIRQGIIHSYHTDISQDSHIFRSGIVLGLSWLKNGEGPGDTSTGINQKSLDKLGELSRQLLAATLLRQHHANRDNGDSHSGPRRTRLEKPRTFIIHHASSTMFAPESLLQSILKASMISARSLPSDPESIPRSGSGLGSGSGSGAGPWSNQPTITTDQAINLLDDVHLIPIFDFPGAVHAIGLVIDEVHRAVGTDPITTSTPATGSPKTGTSITVRNVSTITYQTNDSTQQEMEEEDNEDGEDNTHIIEESPAQAPASSPVKPDKEKSPTAHLPAPLITIIIEGIDTLTENNVIKPSTPMRGTAMLTPVLRTLTHISRMYPNLVAVMLVNWLGLGTTSTISTTKTTTTSTATATTTAAAAGSITGAGGEGGGGGGGGSGGGGGRPVTSNELSGISVADDGGLHSIFTQLSPNFKYGPSMMSSTLSSTSVRQGLGTGTSLCPSLLLRTLDQGVDVHLMISSNGLLRGGSVRGGGAATTGGRRVEAYDLVTAVEVIKDRVGSNVGRWCVWE